jgi:tetratricopeptide (TPR) repeat protein
VSRLSALVFLLVTALFVPRPALAGPSRLDHGIADVSSPDDAKRQAAVAELSSLDADALPAVVRALAENRKSHASSMTAAMKPLKGEAASDPVLAVLHAEKRLEHEDAESTFDGLRAALVEACLARSLAHIGTTPAVRQLVQLVPDAGGAFRPEIARLVKGLGDGALGALVLARRDPSPDVRGFAAGILESEGKRLPSDVVQTKNNQALADVLGAYAAVKDLDAVPVILSFVNSDRAEVRKAARDALRAYGQDAAWKIREALASVTGSPAPDSATAEELAQQLFAAYDALRLREVYALLDQGLAQEKEGKLEDAVVAYDKVLARQPMLDRRGETVPGYLAYARAVESKDRATALAYLRKALRLDEAGSHAGAINGAIDYLEGEELLSRGVLDQDLFRQAVELDPTNGRARAELARLAADREARQWRWRKVAGAGGLFVVCVVGAIVFGGRRRRTTGSR